MAKFRKVHTLFWDDPEIEIMPPDEKLFFLCLLTNPLVSECGIYGITKKKLSNYTGFNLDVIEQLLKRFSDLNKIKYSEQTCEIAILKRGRYLDRLGKPVLDCITAELKKVKNVDLIDLVSQNIENQEVIKIYDTYKNKNTIRDTIRPAIAGQEKEKEKEKEEEEEVNSTDTVEQTEIGIERVKKAARESWDNQSWREQTCIGHKLSESELKQWMAQFNSSLCNDTVSNFTNGAYRKMFNGWLNKQKEKGYKLPEKEKTVAPKLTTLK